MVETCSFIVILLSNVNSKFFTDCLMEIVGILVVWIRRRFLDLEVDGSIHQLYQFVVSLSKTLSALPQTTQLTNEYKTGRSS